MTTHRALACALAILAGACTTNRRLDRVEHRLAGVEGADEDTRKDLVAVGTRLDQIAHMLDAIKEGSDVAPLVDQIKALSTQIAALEQVVARGQAPAPAARRNEPIGTDVYAVPIAGDASDGPADALVTIVRGYDYACPYCEKSRATMDELRQRYPHDVRIVYKSFIVHPQVATLPAEAACAAQQQGQFLAFDARLWAESFPARKWDQAAMETLATETGLDLDRFRADMSGPCITRIGKDQAELSQVGTSATPTFFINGRYLAGAQPVQTFVTVIDEELALARKRVKTGTKKKKYYDTWIVKKGKTSFLKP